MTYAMIIALYLLGVGIVGLIFLWREHNIVNPRLSDPNAWFLVAPNKGDHRIFKCHYRFSGKREPRRRRPARIAITSSATSRTTRRMRKTNTSTGW